MPTEIPLSRDDFGLWQTRVEQARKLREPRLKDWKEAVEAYLGKRLAAMPQHDTVVVNKEYSFVELKKAQLAFQVPEFNLKPKRPGLEQAVHLFQAALNHELGPDGANLKPTLDACLFDVLTCGIAAAEIGYDATIGQKTVMEPPPMDPMSGMPMGQPTPREVEFVMKEDYYWRRVSPDKLLLPLEFEGSQYDQAAWLGIEFEEDLESAKRNYNLPADFKGKTDHFESLSGEKEGVGMASVSERVCGVKLYYRAATFAPDEETHPDAIRCLIYIEGQSTPAVHIACPYQYVGDDGRLMGMMGFPIHPLTLRDVAGSAYPPSDVLMGLHLTEELSKGRTQMVQQRDSAIPMRWFDRNAVDPETARKLSSGTFQGWIPLDGPADGRIGEIVRAQFPRENFAFNDVISNDYEELWALSKSQRGIMEESQRTATELRIALSAADVRLDNERTRVLTWLVGGARKFGALLQQFKDDTSYVEILGPERAQGLQAWNRRLIQGEFVFQAKPDSSQRLDVQAERQQLLNLYNLTGQDPNVARVELLKSLFARFNLDASRIVVEQLPQKGPEPPKLTLSVGGEDLAAPSPLLLAVLQQYGVQLPTQGAMTPVGGPGGGPPTPQPQRPGGMGPRPEPPNPGATPQMEPLSKHALGGKVGVLP